MTKNNKIEETIQSIEGLKRADANPFLYAKIMQRLKEQTTVKKVHSPSKVFILRFALILIFAILVNVYTFISYSDNNFVSDKSVQTTNQNLQSFTKEYSITGSTYNY